MDIRSRSDGSLSFNKIMAKRFCAAIILFLCLTGVLLQNADAQSVTANDLISLINGMRSANGLGALSVDYSLMACAQSTAETMAASHMTWHIGNVSGRASSFGYNNYNKCFATENFMMGSSATTIGQIQASWSDASHMIPAQSSSYCHIGAGVATGSDGSVYFVVQAAYPAGVAGCGFIKTTGSYADSAGSAMIIKAVVTATPNETGMVYHTVEDGQTLWAISEAYHVSISDIQAWNNLYNSTALSLGQKLYIPAKDEAGRTPTPQVELTVLPTADAQGKFYHEVSEGDTLWSISELWRVPLNSIYQANNMNAESSIGLGWQILIPVTATATPVPTETPTLTPTPTYTLTPDPESAVDLLPTAEATAAQNTGGIFHTPKATGRTYIIEGIFLLIAGGAAAVLFFSFRKNK